MKLTSINPATEEMLGEFEAMDFEVAKRATVAAREVQKSWAKISIEERCTLLKKYAQVLRMHADECAKLITLETGKPITQAKSEIEKCAWLADYYAENAVAMLAPEVIATEATPLSGGQAKKSYVRFDPLGIVLAIMPWNFPFWQVIRCAIPSLAAGNVCVLKHASNVPQCALKIEELFIEAGFPEGVFKTLLINSETSGMLIEHDLVDAISLTGSTPAGADVASKAGKHLKKCVLELGGSDPFIILSDADVARAAEVAVQARMINTGQSCIAAKRFIAEKSIVAEFEKYVTEEFKKLKMGDPMDPSVNVGPLAKKEIKADVIRQFEDARSHGAKVLAGGIEYSGKGYFFTPTLITNVTKDMAVWHEEVFGPLMSIFVAADEKEALHIANESQFGLGASVWTRDQERAEKLAGEIESGFVAINNLVKSDPRLPFGGIKKSGFGRELGTYGIKEFVNIKTIVVN